VGRHGLALAGRSDLQAAVREVDRLFSRYADYSLEAELAGKNGEGRYELTEIAQPALVRLQVGITVMLRRRGVVPVAVVGHSVGEVAAAWASGALVAGRRGERHPSPQRAARHHQGQRRHDGGQLERARDPRDA
jgi:acyl transferase domain-containing protein